MFTFNEIDKLIGLKQQTNVTSFRSISVYRALKYMFIANASLCLDFDFKLIKLRLVSLSLDCAGELGQR